MHAEIEMGETTRPADDTPWFFQRWAAAVKAWFAEFNDRDVDDDLDDGGIW